MTSGAIESDAQMVDPIVRVRPVTGTHGWVTWNMTENLTDRWGDLNFNGDNDGAVADLSGRPEDLKRLREQMWDEITFVVRRDGVLGILFEVEYCSSESESHLKNDDSAFYESLRPQADVVQRLIASLAALAPGFEGVEFVVPEEINVIHDRPAAWAFVKDGLLNNEQREALGRAMLSL